MSGKVLVSIEILNNCAREPAMKCNANLRKELDMLSWPELFAVLILRSLEPLVLRSLIALRDRTFVIDYTVPRI